MSRALPRARGARIVETKLRPPRGSPQRIARPRLDVLLEQVSERPATVVRAPGGYGKTTLALAWVEALCARGEAVAWLSLEPEDDEPRRFLRYLIEALGRACRAISLDGAAVGMAPLDDLQAGVVNAIADCGDDLFLFLNDVHYLRHPQVHQCMRFLLRNAPANLRLVMLSRTEPAVGLPTLRAMGAVLEVDAAQLRFTREETREFLELASGQRLAPGEVAAVFDLTQGWPAALRIASLSIRAGREPVEFARAMAGASRHIGGFLDELCALLPDELLQFMIDTSVLDQLAPSLGAAVTGRSDCAGLLRRLEEEQLISPLDPDGEHHAYHHLVRDYLQQRLGRESPDRLRELHRRAAGWYADREDWSGCVKHLLAAGDTAEAVVRVARCADTLVQYGDMLTLLGWEQQLRSHDVELPLQLRFATAWAKTLSLSLEEAATELAAIEQRLATDPPPDVESLRRDCLALRMVRFGLADQQSVALELARDYRPMPGDRVFGRDAAYNVMRAGHVKNAAWQQCYAVPRVLRPLAGDRRSLLTAIYETLVLGLGELEQAHAGPAEQYLVECLRLARDVRGFAGARRLAAGPLAELLFETGRVTEAEALLRDSFELFEGNVTMDSVLKTAMTAARMAGWRGALDQARGWLERAEAIGLTRGWPRLVAAALFERLRLDLWTGRPVAAQGSLRRLEQMHEVGDPGWGRGFADVPHYRALGKALVDAAGGRFREAAATLESTVTNARRDGANLLAIRSGAVLARIHLQARSTVQALREFHAVLELAEPSGFVASIVDAGPEIDALAARAEQDPATAPEGSRRREFLRRLRADLAEYRGGPGRVGRPRQQDARALLSPRECAILEQVAAGQSNKEIARKLGMGPETVKTHLKNVFAKLGVERRTQAVLRAEELGLVRARSVLR